MLELNSGDSRVHNHIENSGAIGDKKGLLYLMTQYASLFHEDIDQILPPTFHIKNSNDKEIQ